MMGNLYVLLFGNLSYARLKKKSIYLYDELNLQYVGFNTYKGTLSKEKGHV